MAIQVTPIPRLTALTTPALTLGTANAAGSALTSIASDSTLLAFDATLPLATGTPSVGTAAVPPRRDHVHAGTSLAAPALTLGTANSAGSAATALATDSTLLAFDGVVPASVGTSATGSAVVASRRDHVHTGAQISTGSYTGDGAATKAIDGLGFQPKFLWITRKYTTSQTAAQSLGSIVWSSTAIVADNAAGMGITGNDRTNGSTSDWWTYTIDTIYSLDSDGFTVGDGGLGGHPNYNTIEYNWIAIG